MRTALAIDLGGTETRAGLVGADGQVLVEARSPTNAAGGPDAVIGELVRLVEIIREARPDARSVGLGVGAPGPLDSNAGIAIAPPTLAGWHDVPLAARLRERLGVEVQLENDANVAALGEWRFGAGVGTQSMVFATISTGIGGGIIADGRLLHGRRGLAGEIGHMTIAEGTERCACGALGCWEALASGTALGREGERLAASGGSPMLRAMAGTGPVTARHVGEAARAGDAGALALLEQEARWLGVGIVNLLHLYSPEVVVLGGGVSQLLDLLRPEMERTVRLRAMSAYRDIPIVSAKLGGHAGLVGAASLVL
ncbi:glucokinase [Kaistia algarum]|uniref:ROK family protein n=1 Tax=Kaistia algarum TaxID=2083279 RepID=UPI000CE7505F|nr:ROK family protein [Kaistia algarum]MCX5512593.1 ROK family protein [Kaistia algarum]PPE82053.1 glucokinase [Kaistia algarum]